MTTIAEVAGIDRRSATRLRKAGVKTAEAFVQRTRGKGQFRLLSEQTGIERDTLLDIAMSVDLMELDGLGSRYCALLKSAGVHTVEDLGRCSAVEVLEKLEAANHRTRLVRRLPSLEYVRSWVRQAQGTDGANPTA